MIEVRKKLVEITKYIEIVIAIILLIAIVISGIVVILNTCNTDIYFGDFRLENFLKTMLTLVIGIEFAKMLILHTPESVLEVLLYAIARQIVIFHDRAIDNLVGVLAVGVIFMIRKYVGNKKEEDV